MCYIGMSVRCECASVCVPGVSVIGVSRKFWSAHWQLKLVLPCQKWSVCVCCVYEYCRSSATGDISKGSK